MNQNTETEITVNQAALELRIETEGPSVVRRLLNVIPVDIEALLKELDEEM